MYKTDSQESVFYITGMQNMLYYENVRRACNS